MVALPAATPDTIPDDDTVAFDASEAMVTLARERVGDRAVVH